jgi:adenylate cyclase
MARRPTQDLKGDPADVAYFEELLTAHQTRMFVRLMRALPSEPRCRLCRAPFGGGGGRVMRRLGYGPSRKNPNICNTCFEKAPMGGVEMEIGVLFADVRGFTSLAEDMAPDAIAQLLNRFYAAATDVLSSSAVVDKLVGDEVMALFIPQWLGEHWEDQMLLSARELLGAVGYGSADGPWLQLGVGIDLGRAFVGNVGSGDVKDFTALGDVVNTAARLQSAAAAGSVVMSERLHERLNHRTPGAVATTLELKGKKEAEPVRVIDVAAGRERPDRPR